MMNQEGLFKKIGNILTELQDQFQYVSENPQEVNELDLELFLSNANFLTDHIQIVMKSLSHQELKMLPRAAETKALDAPHNEQSDIDRSPATFEFVLKEEQTSPKFDFEEKKVEELFNRPLSVEEQAIIARKQQLETPAPAPSPAAGDDEIGPEPFLVPPTPAQVQPVVETVAPVQDITPIAPEVKEEPVQVIQTRDIEEAEVVAPVFSEPAAAEKSAPKTLNERLASSMASAPKTETAKPEITDLKQSINLNDKLLYIKDLFHGYGLAYAEAIDLLNKMPDFKSADAFLQKNYAAQNNWASKQSTVEKFYELLTRRFPH